MTHHDPNAREAARRVATACDMIRGAYRLHPTMAIPDTLAQVREAIAHGAMQAAHDTADEARDTP